MSSQTATDADYDLERVLKKSSPQREEELFRLFTQHQRHGRIALEVAKLHAQGRRIEEARAALLRGLTNEPALERTLPAVLRDLMTTNIKQQVAAAAAAAAAAAQRPAPVAPAADQPPSQPSGSTQQGRLEPRAPAKTVPDPIEADPDTAAELERALGVQDHLHKAELLRGLHGRFPHSPSVLHHLALETALLGNAEEARRLGETLKQISASHYGVLYEAADELWKRGLIPGSQQAEANLAQMSTIMVILDSPAAPPPPSSLPQGSRICERCWTTFDHNATICPDARCRTPRPQTDWPRLPYRFRGKYIFVSKLGNSAMAAVFQAECLEAGTPTGHGRAVKIPRLHTPMHAPRRLREMFEQEVRAASLLGQQASFIQVLGFDINGSQQPYLEMELVSWPTLCSLREHNPRMAPLAAARMGAALLKGLALMHEHRMVHRDLKPSNIFVDAQDTAMRIKIGDLGNWVYDSRAHTRGAEARELIGTLAYMSPEQMQMLSVTTAADIHSAGTILWEALTGEVPYPAPRAPSATESMRLRYERCRHPPLRPARMPHELYWVLARALAHDPTQRWSSITMSQALEHVANGMMRTLETAVTRIDGAISQLRYAQTTPSWWQTFPPNAARGEQALLDLRKRSHSGEHDPTQLIAELDGLLPRIFPPGHPLLQQITQPRTAIGRRPKRRKRILDARTWQLIGLVVALTTTVVLLLSFL